MYLGGHPEALAPTLAIPVLENCLIARNSAFADGGGVSVNWYAEPIFADAIADNVVTSQDGLGGGLYCAYDSNSSLRTRSSGATTVHWVPQIALITGGEYYPLPTSLDITHSVIFDTRTARVRSLKTRPIPPFAKASTSLRSVPTTTDRPPRSISVSRSSSMMSSIPAFTSTTTATLRWRRPGRISRRPT